MERFETCQSQGLGDGALACAGDCSFDVSGCSLCGNNQIDAGEQCDGIDLGGMTCQPLGYASGTLACLNTCTFDDSDCSGICSPTGGALSCGSVVVDNTGISAQATDVLDDYNGQGCGTWSMGCPEIVYEYNPGTQAQGFMSRSRRCPMTWTSSCCRTMGRVVPPTWAVSSGVTTREPKTRMLPSRPRPTLPTYYIVVTYDQIDDPVSTQPSSFQIGLYWNGNITITSISHGGDDALVGITEGNGAQGPPEVDFYTPPPVQGYFEKFDSTQGDPFDLNGRLITFTPNPGGPQGYTYQDQAAVSYPFAPGTGNLHSQQLTFSSGDTNQMVALTAGHSILFYEQTWSSFYVGAPTPPEASRWPSTTTARCSCTTTQSIHRAGWSGSPTADHHRCLQRPTSRPERDLGHPLDDHPRSVTQAGRVQCLLGRLQAIP